ncbi:MAG TPA: M20/M25/M40 family metallo-hydrolase, partial [Terriglobales bacterium]|nr:M20/M25/M40 family metallo-hydrolase [Terriglobales bacterium]
MQRIFERIAFSALALIVAAANASAQTVCSGDCDGDGEVIVAELLTGINIALGSAAIASCTGLDRDGDLQITVDELTAATGNALIGCTEIGEDVFDGFRAADLEYLASDELDGRDNGTPGSLAAQQYLIEQIRGLAVGLNPAASGDDAFKQAFPTGTNIIGVIPGTESPEEFVVVGGHYDHFGGCSGVCNGATDNAAGTVAVLAIARELADNPRPLRRSVVIAFWDAEEDGLLGSEHYIGNPLVPLAQTVAYVNFDIQGANLLPSL